MLSALQLTWARCLQTHNGTADNNLAVQCFLSNYTSPHTIGLNLMLLLEVKFAINEKENLTHHLLSASTADIFSILTLSLFSGR